MPTPKKTLAVIAILLLIIVVTSIYFVSKQPAKPEDQNIETTTNGTVSTSTLTWTKDEIFYSGKKLLSINDFPNEIEVAKDVSFGSSVAFTGAELNPLKTQIALTITGGVHEFGWLYDLKNEKLVPVAFSFDGGVSLVGWKSDHEIIFNITSPKPTTSEIVIDTNKLPEYPRIKLVTGASIREEMGVLACPEMMIINKMPGPGSKKESYYIVNGKRVEQLEYDPIWISSNCEVPVQEVY
jgi:hypothetical protein